MLRLNETLRKLVKNENNSLLLLSIISSILVILYQFLQWSIIDILTPFLEPFISLLVHGFAFVVTLMVILSLRKGFQWKFIVYV